MSPELCCQQGLGSLGHMEQQTLLLVQIKEEEQELWKEGLLEQHCMLKFTQKPVMQTA